MLREPLILTTDDHRFILVRPTVADSITGHVESGAQTKEAGGILIGSYRGNDIEIHGCTLPLPCDIRSRTMLDRRDPGHHDAAMRAWRSSKGTDTYVGEWHTHPEDSPCPSSLDYQTWLSLTTKRNLPMVFAIGGRHSIWWGFGVGKNVQRLFRHAKS